MTAAEKERADKLAAIGKPAFSETETDTAIKNGGFEEGLVNWLMLDGNAFGARALCSDEMFWANPDAEVSATTNRPYNKEGKNFLNTYFDEDAQGSIRSTKFTLAGDGIVSFLMAGSPSDKNYVALCDSEGNELETVTFANTFADPALTENMVRHYIDAKEHIGKVLYLKVVDGALPTGGGFRGIVVDDFKVSQTKTEVEAQMKADYERSCAITEPTVAAAEQKYYSEYTYPEGCQLTVLRFQSKIGGKAVKAGTVVDLTGYLDGVKALYGDASDFTYAITGVTKGDTAVSVSNFAAATFTEAGLYTVGYSATHDGMTINETFLLNVAPADGVLNADFECGSLDGWTVEGDVASVIDGSVFWEGDQNFFDQDGKTVQSYQKEGNYFLVTDEGKTGTIKSSVFTVQGDYISFKFGIAKSEASYVALCDAATDVEIAKVTNHETFNDPTLAQIMLRRFIDVSELNGVEVYIKIVDGATSDFGFLNFDDLRINMTAEEAAALLKADQDWAATYRQDVLDADDAAFPGSANRAKDIINAIRNYYNDLALNTSPKAESGALIVNKAVEGYAELAYSEIADFDFGAWLGKNVAAIVVGVADPSITITVTEIKKGSETLNVSGFAPVAGEQYAVKYTVSYAKQGADAQSREYTFTLNVLRDGQILNGGFELGNLDGWTMSEGMTGGVISADKYWGEELPYNQSGNFHLDGWSTGIAEAGTWSVKSETFVLGGAGIITVKMGGHAAAVKVYQVDGSTETLIGYYKQTAFNDAHFPDVTQGSWADMRTYVIDLKDHKGETLRIELCDEAIEGGWANAFFDEVITYYEEDTTVADLLENKDKVMNGHGGDNVEATEVELDWIEATSEPIPTAAE